MADSSSPVPARDSFEQFEEATIFSQHDYFVYHKYNHECNATAITFQKVLQTNVSHRDGILHLHQPGEEPIDAEILRSVAMHCGANVVSACFGPTFLTDKMVEGVLPHLCRLRFLQFDGLDIGSIAARATSMFCHKTLESLRLSRCRLITSESCGWLAGIIGHNSPRLHKLKALDVSATNVTNRGLTFLSEGLGQLEHLDLGDCAPLTFTGKGLQESLGQGSFGSMVVLNLRGCKGILDEGIAAIARAMPKLQHLNLSRCGRITDEAASALGGGCARLVTLSVEGALGITDAGLGMICNRTKLDLLNVTGCSIARKSLLAVILALGYVEESSSFFGFVLRDPSAKVAALEMQEMVTTRERGNQAAHVILGGWNAKRHTIHVMQSAREVREQQAATRIQECVLKYKSRQRFDALGNIRKLVTCSISIQKMARGWLARQKTEAHLALTRILCVNARIIQKRYRGKFVRSRDTLVMPAVLALRAARLHEKRTKAATTIQCCRRNIMAMKTLKRLRRNFMRRRYFSTLLAAVGRCMLARRRLRRLRLSSELRRYYRRKKAIQIQCFVRQWSARGALDRRLHVAGERYLLEHKSARKIQSKYRCWLDWCAVRRKRLAWNKAAVAIQRIFRGKCVKHWQEMKMDAIWQYVLERTDCERAKASLAKRNGYTRSSSEECQVDGSPPNLPSDDELIKYVFGYSFVNLRCLIYWPDDGLYKSGSISNYDGRMQLWRIDYDGDDSEWLDLVREQERVMAMGDAFSWIPFNYCQPPAMRRYLQKRKTIEPSNSTWTPPTEQICSDVFYCSYVTRGLLDECYHTGSPKAIQKLRDAHPVKALTVALAKAKYHCGANSVELSETVHFEHLLGEVCLFLEENKAAGDGCI